jgi:hypothetical protein
VSCKLFLGNNKDASGMVPEKFPFPFEPYDIQQQFMRQLYQCLQTGNVGIFESPTGTVNIHFLHLTVFAVHFMFLPLKTFTPEEAL